MLKDSKKRILKIATGAAGIVFPSIGGGILAAKAGKALGEKTKENQILNKVITGVKDFVRPDKAKGKKGAEFAEQVMKSDKLLKDLYPNLSASSPKKKYSDKMISDEAKKIFVKNNQGGPLAKYKDKVTGLYPETGTQNDEFLPKEYTDEVRRVSNQVKKTRRAQSK